MKDSATMINTSIHVTDEADRFDVDVGAKVLPDPTLGWVFKFVVNSYPHGKQGFTWFGTEKQMKAIHANLKAAITETNDAE